MQRPVQVGNLDAVRDWGHALDFCRAFYLINTQSDKKTPELPVFVVATSESITVR